MGQIFIDMPLNSSFNYLIQNIDVAEAMIEELKDTALKVEKYGKAKMPVIEPPKTSIKEGLEAAFGLWANRKETGETLSREIREANGVVA